MKIFRVKNPDGVDYIKDKLLPDMDYSPGQFEEGLKTMLRENPDRCFFLCAFEEETPMAFVIVLAPPELKHTYILQAWADESVEDSSLTERMFVKVCMWTESLGRDEIRAETLRNPKAFLRKWGFTKHSTVMSFKLDEDFEQKLLAACKKPEPEKSEVKKEHLSKSETSEKPAVKKPITKNLDDGSVLIKKVPQKVPSGE